MAVQDVLTRGAATAAMAFGGYALVGRPWHLTWGATEEEARRPLPGDELMPNPTLVSTRAVDLAAPPDAVWPWLVQVGKDRGGLYSYTTLENLFGLGIENADHILPEHQQLQPGDEVKLSPDRFALVVRQVDEPHSLVFEFRDGGWIWAFHVDPAPGGSRLVVRNRWDSTHGGVGWRVSLWATEPAAFIMEQRMLRGVAERVAQSAEREER